MPRHPAAAALVLVLAASLTAFAQVPARAPGAAPDVPPTPLLTEPPLETDTPPITIPESPDPSITALENAVLATHDAFLAALEMRDDRRLAAALTRTNRGAMIVDGRLILTTDDLLESHRGDFAEVRHLHYSYTQRHVTILSATSAMLVGTGTAHGQALDGTSLERTFAHTFVFLGGEAGWRIVHWHSSTPRPRLGE